MVNGADALTKGCADHVLMGMMHTAHGSTDFMFSIGSAQSLVQVSDMIVGRYVCTYVYIRTYVFIYVYMYIYVYVYLCVYLFMDICMLSMISFVWLIHPESFPRVCESVGLPCGSPDLLLT